jgi:hypothetical protein
MALFFAILEAFPRVKNCIIQELKEMSGKKDKINEQLSNVAEDEDIGTCRQP